MLYISNKVAHVEVHCYFSIDPGSVYLLYICFLAAEETSVPKSMFERKGVYPVSSS